MWSSRYEICGRRRVCWAARAWHTLVVVLSWSYSPAAQSRQEKPPAPYCPTTQPTHVVPPPVELLPFVHAAHEVLELESRSAKPTAQLVQAEEPGAAYLPVPQALQTVRPALPAMKPLLQLQS